MTWAHVQNAGAESSASGTTTLSATFGSSVTPGNLIVVGLANYGGGATTVQDSVSLTNYAEAVLFGTTTQQAGVWWFVVPPGKGGSGFEVTVTSATSGDPGMSIDEFSFSSPATISVDATATGSGASSSSLAVSSPGTTLTPTGTDLIYCASALGNNGTYTPGSGFTTAYSGTFTSGHAEACFSQYALNRSTVITPAATTTVNLQWSMAAVAFLAATDSASSAYDALILSESSLVDYWQLDEQAGLGVADSQGPRPLTIGGSNPPTLNQTGLPSGGSAFLFNGQGGSTGSYAKTTPGFNIGGTGVSIEAWVYIATNPGEAEWICGAFYSGFLVGDLQINSGRDVFFDCWDNGASGKTITGTQLPLGQWIHLVGVGANAGLMQLYINTVAQTGQTLVGSAYLTTNGTVTSGWNIGGGVTSGKDAKFTIAKVALYNALLTPTQISNHYNAGLLLVSAFPAALLAAI